MSSKNLPMPWLQTGLRFLKLLRRKLTGQLEETMREQAAGITSLQKARSISHTKGGCPQEALILFNVTAFVSSLVSWV